MASNPKIKPDVTNHRVDSLKIEEARNLARLYSAVIDNFPGGIILTDRDLNVILCNDKLKQILEFPENLFEGRTPTLPEIFQFNALRGEYGPGNPESLVAAKMLLVEKRISHVFERTRPDGRILEIRGTAIAEGGFVTSYTDVTERSLYQKYMFDLANKDSLTGLANRFALKNEFVQFARRAKRGEGFALLYIDLDNFKPINDKHGHRIGDAVIVEIARRVTECTRETDIVARVGGDEFVVLQSNVKQVPDIVTFARRLVTAIHKPFVIESLHIQPGASVGICSSLFSPGEIDFDMMVGHADSQMYKSKVEAKGTFHIHGCNAKAGNCHFSQCGCLLKQQCDNNLGAVEKANGMTTI
jgi:diguanylate cyclase (GGDEF)-like protein